MWESRGQLTHGTNLHAISTFPQRQLSAHTTDSGEEPISEALRGIASESYFMYRINGAFFS